AAAGRILQAAHRIERRLHTGRRYAQLAATATGMVLCRSARTVVDRAAGERITQMKLCLWQPAAPARGAAKIALRALPAVLPLNWGGRPARAVITLGVLMLISAAPPSAEDWERRGNDAFADARFDEAAKCYAAAEESSIDPGRVAFNHGVALFSLGRYREAER